jgi:hypothetical protein
LTRRWFDGDGFGCVGDAVKQRQPGGGSGDCAACDDTSLGSSRGEFQQHVGLLVLLLVWLLMLQSSSSQVKDLVTVQPVVTPLWAAPEVSFNNTLV